MARQLIGVLLTVLVLAPRPDVNAAFDAFWAAESPEAAARLTHDIVKSGITFDDAYRRPKLSRTYATQPTGMVRLTSRLQPRGIDHHFAVNVPADYDPSKKYQVRFQLHCDLRTENCELRTQTQNSELRTQNLELTARLIFND